ncbi:Leucine-rich repeat-containing protein 29, partial [Borealophlyctis nickersoniae]
TPDPSRSETPSGHKPKPKPKPAKIDAYLPTELLLRIFARLDARSRCRATRVSPRWRDASYNTPKLWQRLDLSNRYSLGGEKCSTVLASQAPSLHSSPSPCEGGWTGSNATLVCLLSSPAGPRRFSRLTRVDLSCTQVDLSVFDVPAVKNVLAKSLTHLILNGCTGIESGGLYHLRGLKALRALDLSHCEMVDDMGLEVLAHYLPHLTHLNLSYLFRLTERGVSRLFRLPGLVSVNLMGCYRIKAYPWALGDHTRRGTLPLRELMLGEDSRIQTRGFWLLWCTFNFDTTRLVTLCPFLETLRLNMVLFDLPPDGLDILLKGCRNLKNLSLVVDRAAVPSLCAASEHLQTLTSLEFTVHIGVTGELVSTLVRSKAVSKLTALKFHSKHTTVFDDASLAALVNAAPGLEYLELNGDDVSATGLSPIPKKLGKSLQSLLLHHVSIANGEMKKLSRGLPNLREFTATDLQQMRYSNKIRWMFEDRVACLKLKKVELSSFRGFSDKDLAWVPKNCPNLQ